MRPRTNITLNLTYAEAIDMLRALMDHGRFLVEESLTEMKRDTKQAIDLSLEIDATREQVNALHQQIKNLFK